MTALLLAIALAAAPSHTHKVVSTTVGAKIAAGSWSNTTSTRFFGTDDVVRFGNNLNVNLSNTEWTISAWVRPTDVSAQGYILAKAAPFAGTPDFNWIVGVTTASHAFAYWGDVGKTTEGAGAALAVGSFHHVVSTVRNITGTFTASLWVDGVQQGSDVTTPGTNSSTVVAGFGGGYVADSPDVLYPYIGYIDEVTIWDAGMTSAHVTTLYNSGVPANPTSHTLAANLTHYYRMGDGDTFPTITDRAGAVNGTCTNMAGAGTNFTSTVP